MSDDDFAAPVKHVRAQHANIGVLAPNAERVLTVMCGRRVVAAVWPVWSPRKYVVTAAEAAPLDLVTRRVVAPCQCKRAQHVLDLDKLSGVRGPHVSALSVSPT